MKGRELLVISTLIVIAAALAIAFVIIQGSHEIHLMHPSLPMNPALVSRKG
ncbi:MAG: hypothetical protein QW330_02665 [Nitrososphaerota archaeon]